MNNSTTATEAITNQEVSTMGTAVSTETINQEEKTMGQIFDEATITMEQNAQNEQTGNQNEEKKPRDKSERFVELAVTRTNKVIDVIDSLGKLASKKNYSYTKEQVDKIFQAIQKELEDVKYEFEREKSEPIKKRFSLE